MQENYEKNFFNTKNVKEQSTASGDNFSGSRFQVQAHHLREIHNLRISIKLTINKMAEKINKLEQ